MNRVLVPAVRVERWFANFETRHGAATYTVADGGLLAVAEDGATGRAVLPLDRAYAGAPEPSALAAAALAPHRWGVLLVRKGGFAVARLAGDDLVEHKVGQRHVQGRSKAGGQSQQRFARRRDNQAQAAYDAAAGHAARVLGPPHRLHALVTGGDRTAVEAVLEDVRLAGARDLVVSRWLPVPDPRRAVLDQAVVDALSVEVTVGDGPS
ncbi:MAG: FIG00865945: hypothetical protein [uncultured Nocardioidaceae bacterium]|uniref:Actinobacteria/chloroflexi VLRF1 release factor domain-containing protein n=1 Tax=uncultured Nocardioidaceae bacterium TaxID=253824 RepID=A0A6J4M314_9ACTN|nr:MAG: FIG00865945: hypothetical protein [uncultured Nocardioidaceae bacterium]